jgi:hypothetical protein
MYESLWLHIVMNYFKFVLVQWRFDTLDLQLLGSVIAGIMSNSEESCSSTLDNVDSGGNAIVFSIQQLSDVRFVMTYWEFQKFEIFGGVIVLFDSQPWLHV